ncbi:hypothetical protein [Pseudosulfitobacter pseudonitzschiae]|uniref:hypothetical protein n=1 Tax=Pseudosulfitobacter pseudonitzschiae TaxID=1402135 RepID=UPI003B7F13F3
MNLKVTDLSRHALVRDGGYTEMLVSEMPDGHFAEIMSFSPDRGLGGATMVRRTKTSLDRVIEAYMDPDAMQGPDVRTSRDGIHEGLLEEVLRGKSGRASHDNDQKVALVRMLKTMLKKHLPGDTLDLLRVMPPINTGRNGEPRQSVRGPNVTLLTSGDQAARVQAIKANFGLLGLIMKSDELLHLIDNHEPINRFIKDHYDLDRDQFRALRKMTRTASGYITGLSEDPGFKGVNSITILSDTDRMAEMARIVRPDQVPDSWSGLLQMFSKIDVLSGFSRSTGLGDTFVRRAIRTVSADQWQEFLPESKGGQYAFNNGISDYLKTTTGIMASAIVMEAVLSKDEKLLYGVSRAASDLLSSKDVSGDALDRLSRVSSFLARPDIESLRESVKSEIKEIFGRSASLKELRERSTRWHHINQLLSSRVTSEGVDITWEPLVGKVDLSSSTAIEMTSSTRLAEQGARENHCVGSYAGVILNPPYSGARALFSIEDGEDVLSTVEIEIGAQHDERGRRYLSARSIQHQAHSNTEPSMKAVTAVNDLIEALNLLPQEQLSGYISGIKSNPHGLRQKVGKQITLWGGNIYSDDFSSLGLAAYQDVIPRRLRGDVSDIKSFLSNDTQQRITSIIGDALSGIPPKTEVRSGFAAPGNEYLASLLSRPDRDSRKHSWLGVILEELNIEEFEVSLSGYGDSGNIESYDFPRMDGQPSDPLSTLDEIRMPGDHKTLRDILDGIVDRDATSEGNWYDNEGGNVWSKYVVSDGELVVDTVILTHNEPDEEDEDEFDDEFEEEIEP